MKIQLFLFLAVAGIVTSCAQRGAPTGGPKDEMPPQLISTQPVHESLNFEGEEVVLTFDEYIDIKNLPKELIISPRIDQEYDTRVVKNRLEIEFEEPLEDSTTYIFEFNKGIVDITEGNAAENPKLAFSTGPGIDTLKIKGQVKHYMTQQPAKEVTVAIYSAGDTLDLLNSEPLYFTKTNEAGEYLISYVKPGEYKLYTFRDKNNDLKCNPASEAHGFYEKNVKVSKANDSLSDLQLYAMNIGELKMITARPSSTYFDIRFNKTLSDYQLEPLNKKVEILSNLQEEQSVVRVYQNEAVLATDSLAATIMAMDSVAQSVKDTVYIKFYRERDDFAEFSSSFKPEKGEIIEEFTGVFKFDKPITSVNTDSLFFQYDSLTIEPVDFKKEAEWNEHHDQLTIRKTLDREKVTAKKEKEVDDLDQPKNQPQTTEEPLETEEEIGKEPITEGKSSNKPKKGLDFSGKVRFYAARASFISVDNDSSKTVDNFYTFKESKEYATLKGKINTQHKHFIIQLLDKDYKIVDEIQDQKDYAFEFVKPGDYYVRVLVDNNDNGIWEYGNIYKNQKPEEVIISKEKISLRANWEVADIDFEF